MNLRNYKDVDKRRKALEKELGIKLGNIGLHYPSERVASFRNCENMIGAASIPLGIAGPVRIKNFPERGTKILPRRQAGKNYYIPLATTEGALVASVNRGSKAVTESGGADVEVRRVGATRGPVFRVNSLKESFILSDFIYSNKNKFQKIAESTSRHIKLTDLSLSSVGLRLFVRFVFDTQDAMGMNMATIATEKIVRFIEQKTSARCVSLSGNYCVDKKASYMNFLYGRGFQVWAETVLPHKVVKEVLKTTPEKIYETWLSKCMIGSAMTGSMGFNAHFANVIAAIFIATGQDPAHVVEGSLGVTVCEIVKTQNSCLASRQVKLKTQSLDKRGQLGMQNDTKDLYVSVYLPDLMVGTVGGGTGLATQKEALSILGVYGGNNGMNSERFAGIVGIAVLAGEISLLASLAEGSLARAHERLARGGGFSI